MLVSEKLAIAAHLHVLLRRKTGRVTDTEWMAANLAYATEIVRFARAKAVEDGHPDLADWADKLERAVVQGAAPAPVPLAQAALGALRRREGPATVPPSTVPPSTFGDSLLEASSEPPAPAPGALTPRYVGGIR